MKKWTLFLSLYFCVALALGGCAGNQPAASTSAPPEETPPLQAVTCRVVDAGEDGLLTLAELDGPGVYTLSAPEAEVQPGQLVDVEYNDLLETYPAQFGGDVTVIPDTTGGFDDRCALYLRVLNDLWEEDPGLNGGVAKVGVDLSATSLSDSEQSAVAWVFAGQHGVELVGGAWQELADGGYFTAPEMDPGSDCIPTYQWEDGCFYSITEKPMEGVYSLTPVTFDAEKWRSGTGAYFFCDCTALQSGSGQWSDYTVGSFAIA